MDYSRCFDQRCYERTQRWAYDGTGQRLSEIETLPSQAPDTTLYHYSTDRLDSTTGAVAQSFDYDANGSMTRKGTETFRYDAKMRLQQAQTVGQPLNVFIYDPMGLRVQTVNSEGKTSFLIDPTSTLGRFNTMSVSTEYKNGAKSREYGLGTSPDEVLWEENGEGLFYLLYDGLGSVVAATNANGQVVAQMAYDAFGKVFSQSGQAQDVRYGYTGRPTDKDIGLQYNRSRYYDAGVGRWNRADEYRGELMVPASLQQYVYVNQNPIAFTDPSGFKANIAVTLTALTWFAEQMFLVLAAFLEQGASQLTNWEVGWAKAAENIGKMGAALGFFGLILFNVLALANVAASTKPGLCRTIKYAIVEFWTIIGVLIGAVMVQIFPAIAWLPMAAIGVVYSIITTRVTNIWFKEIDARFECKCIGVNS